MSLDGARLKVVRAQEHLESLRDTINRYLQTDPYVVSVEHNAEGWGGQADITHHPDPRISAIIGDCLYNLRCALDYIIWEIAGTYAGRILLPPPIGGDKLYFPLFDIPAEFQKSLSALSKYKLRDPVIAALEAVQPYNAGYEPLALLHTLVNVDKHRLPLLVLGDIHQFEINVTTRMRSSKFPPQFSSDPDYLKPHVQTQATVYVAWQDSTMPREPVERTIENMVKCVANIVPLFDKFVL